jgi:hypothetical protein
MVARDRGIREQQSMRVSTSMVTVEINLALWRMIFCAAMQTGQRLVVY